MSRSTLCRLAHAVQLAAMGVWCGSVAMSGVSAALIFPRMKDMAPTLSGFADYGGDHAMLAGGRIASPIFFAVDAVQFVCGFVVLATLIGMLLCGYALRTPLRVVRSVLTLATLGVLSYHLTIMMPEMSEHLRTYWELAAQGDTAGADVAKDAFMRMHPVASRTIGTLTVMTLLCALIAGFTGPDGRDFPELNAKSDQQDDETTKGTTHA